MPQYTLDQARTTMRMVIPKSMQNSTPFASGGGEIYYSQAAVCTLLGISRATLWRMRKRGLRTVRIGGLVRIRQTDLDKYLGDNTN